MIRALTLVDNSIKEVEIRQITIGKTNVWVDVIDPSVQELKTIHEVFDLPFSELQHCLDQEERPRVKVDATRIFVFFRALAQQERKMTVPLTCVLAKKYMITIHKHNLPAIESIDIKNESIKVLFKESIEFLLYKILHNGSKEAIKIIEETENQLENIENNIIKITNEEILTRIFSLKKKLLYVRTALGGNRDVVTVLLQEIAFIKEKSLFAEIEIEIMQAVEMIELLRERLTSVIEIYVTNTSNKINAVMKSITIIATLLSLPILVTGLYGMNIRLPLDTHPQAFWIIVGLLVLSIMTTLIVFQRKRWL